jgi:hypothetical protein
MIRIRIEDQAAWLSRRKVELGITGQDYVARNDGSRRSPEKRALLRAIHDDALAQGREPPFYANIGD